MFVKEYVNSLVIVFINFIMIMLKGIDFFIYELNIFNNYLIIVSYIFIKIKKFLLKWKYGQINNIKY